MHAIAPAGGSVFKLRHQDRRHSLTTFTRSIRSMHAMAPPEAPFSSYGTKTFAIVTTFTRSDHTCDGRRRRLRFQVTAPRPSPLSPPSPDVSDPCMRWPPPEAPFSSYGTKTFATVTTFTRSIRSMHAMAPAGGSAFKFGTKTVTTVTTFTRSVRSMHVMAPTGGSISSYGTKTVATVTTFTRSFRFMKRTPLPEAHVKKKKRKED